MEAVLQNTATQIYPLYVPTIVPSRWQPRTSFDPEALLELAKHIDDHGLMYPVIVFVNEDGEHELVAGERRTRAVAALGLSRCSTWIAEHGSGLRNATAYVAEHGWHRLAEEFKQALVMEGVTIDGRIEDNGDHRRLHQLAVADNIQRENLSPLEEARAIQGLIDACGYSQRDVARQIGWSQSKVQERLSLLHMAKETQEALTARAIGPSHARHLAKLPEAVQPAVTRHVQELISKEGDQAATTRQIAVLSSQVRKFLEPDHWLPTPDRIYEPLNRNNLRLVRYLLQTADLEERAETIVALRDAGDYSHTNVIGKDPAKLNNWCMSSVLKALTGKDKIDHAWLMAATLQGWTCETCHLRDVAPPIRNGFEMLCPLHQEDAPPTQTCRHYRAVDEPLAILLSSNELVQWAQKLEVKIAQEPAPHLVNYDAWRDLVERATEARDAQRAAAEQERETRHIVEIAAYWQEQEPGGAFDLHGRMPHFQAHHCHKCAHYRHDLRERDLPPCTWVTDALPNHWGSGQRSPTFAVLVREDGLMVPRCEQFRNDVVLRIEPSEGFVLPDRAVVLEWVHRMLVGGNYGSRNGALHGPGTWLPYGRPPERTHDLDGLLRYLRDLWDDVGDEAMATLITVLCSEGRALAANRGALNLVDPTTGESEAWQALQWSDFESGRKPYNWPDGWPTPWIKEAQ